MRTGGSYRVNKKGKPERIEGTVDPDGPLGLRNAEGLRVRADGSPAEPPVLRETPLKED